MRHFLLLAGALSLAACKTDVADPAAPTADRNAFSSSEDAASEALDALRQLVAADPTAYGFADADEVSRAELGPEVGLRILSFDRLVGSPDGQLEDLLTDDERSVYPVMVDQTLRSSVSLAHEGNDWRIASVADGVWAGVLDASPVGDLAAIRIVSAPGLGADFVQLVDDPSVLIPTRELPEAGLKPGERYPADLALDGLREQASVLVQENGAELQSHHLVR